MARNQSKQVSRAMCGSKVEQAIRVALPVFVHEIAIVKITQKVFEFALDCVNLFIVQLVDIIIAGKIVGKKHAHIIESGHFD
jgi:hypothetical protein